MTTLGIVLALCFLFVCYLAVNVFSAMHTRRFGSHPAPALLDTGVAAESLNRKTAEMAARAILVAKLGRALGPSGLEDDEVQFYNFTRIDSTRALIGYNYTRRRHGAWSGTVRAGWSAVVRVVLQEGQVMAHELDSVSIEDFERSTFPNCRNNPTRCQRPVCNFAFTEDDAQETIKFVASMQLYANYPDWTSELIATKRVCDDTILVPKTIPEQVAA